MKTNIKAIITCFFISKTTIAVNKRETIYFIISVYDKRLSSFFISLILSLFFYLHLLFPLPFCFNFVVSERNVHSFLPTYLAEFSLLFWTFLSGTFFQVGGGGCTCTHCTPLRPRLHIPSDYRMGLFRQYNRIQAIVCN